MTLKWKAIGALSILAGGVLVNRADQPKLMLAGSDAGYVEADSCATCHGEIASSYALTGMGRSFRSVQPESSLPEFDGDTFAHDASRQFFTPYAQEGKYAVRRHQTGLGGAAVNLLDKQVHYVLGSGAHARSYLHRTPTGKLIEFPVTWYAENGGHWAMSPAYDRPNHAGFSREITYRCLFCHNGYPEIVPGSDYSDDATTFPGRLPEGIDCQRCHGPGRAHLQAVRQGESPQRIRNAIVNPARLNSRRQMEICMQCHLETTSLRLPAALMRFGRGVFSYRPGEPLENYVLHFDHVAGSGHDDKLELVSSVYRLRQSACFQKSAGALGCTTCHNPHKALRGEEASRHYSQVCRQCHGASIATAVREKRHPAGIECISCHMPRRKASDAIRISITDHFIRAHPAGDPPAPTENHDGNTPRYRGEVKLYYPSSLPATPENELLLAVAQVKQQSNLREGSARLQRAIGRRRPERSEFYFELGEAYRQAQQPALAISYYAQALQRKPVRWQHYYGKGLAHAAAGQASAAIDAFGSARQLASNEAVLPYALGAFYSQLGRLPDAVSTFRSVLAANPEMADVHNNLGTALLRSGDVAGAEASLREAIRLRPELAVTHFNLGLALGAQSKFEGALQCFETALRQEPTLVEADLKLGETLILLGQPALAKPHLERAAQSPQTAIRKTAMDLLAGVKPGP